MTTKKEGECYNRLLLHIDTLEAQVHRIRDQLAKLKSLIINDDGESQDTTQAVDSTTEKLT